MYCICIACVFKIVHAWLSFHCGAVVVVVAVVAVSFFDIIVYTYTLISFSFFLFVAHLSSLLTMHNHETFFYFHMCIVHCTGSIVPDNCAHTRTHVHFPHLLLCDSYTHAKTITIDFQISFQIDFK